jgi:4-hydroxythreonine-4-phosphate dehydrogenase
MYGGPIEEPSDLPADPMGHPGHAAIACLEHATSRIDQSGLPAFLLTAPIQKSAMHKAGFKFPGHTEYLAARARVKRVYMLMASRELRVLLVTVHEALSLGPKLLTVSSVPMHSWQRLTRAWRISALRSRAWRWPDSIPRIRSRHVRPGGKRHPPAGARPRRADGHPARMKASFLAPFLPIPFFGSAHWRYDMVVALYHDQG